MSVTIDSNPISIRNTCLPSAARTWSDDSIDALTRGVNGGPLVLRGVDAFQCLALARAGLHLMRSVGCALEDFFEGIREWKALPASECSGCQRRQVALEDATRVIGRLGTDVGNARRETVEARAETTRWVARMKHLERDRDVAVEVLQGRRKVGNHG